MVSAAPHLNSSTSRGARRRRSARPAGWTGCALAAGLIWCALCLLPGGTRAQDHAIYFLTAKVGYQTAQGSGDTLFDALQQSNGPVQESRLVQNQGLELDIYAIPRGRFGLAIGLEVMNYTKSFTFSDPSGVLPPATLSLDARSVLYTLKGFWRFGDVLPFAGIGSGNYYVKYRLDPAGISFLDSAPSVFSYRAGLRWLYALHWSLLAETGQTNAPLRVETPTGTAILELGGQFTNIGIGYAW